MSGLQEHRHQEKRRVSRMDLRYRVDQYAPRLSGRQRIRNDDEPRAHGYLLHVGTGDLCHHRAEAARRIDLRHLWARLGPLRLDCPLLAYAGGAGRSNHQNRAALPDREL